MRALLPESRTARSAAGRLTTVACTVSATSSSVAAPAATVARSWKAYVPTRYSVTVGRSSPDAHIAGVPPAETVSTSSPASRASRSASPRNASAPSRDGYVRKPPKRSPSVRAIPDASAAAASGVATPTRPSPVSHSTSTRSSGAPCIARGQAREQALVVDADGHRDPLGERAEPLELLLAEQVVRDQDVVDARAGHHLRLAELLAGDAPRAERDLTARDLDGLVRLDVRAVREADGIAVPLPPLEVPVEAVEVDDDGRRVDLDHVAGIRATASISTRIPPGRPTWTVVRAGYGSANAAR